jgi:hypothetical protein
MICGKEMPSEGRLLCEPLELVVDHSSLMFGSVGVKGAFFLLGDVMLLQVAGFCE